MCSVFRASEVLNTTNSEPQCISCVLLCSVVFRASEVLNTNNSEPRCIISCVLLCSVVFTTNTTNSEPQCIISCGGGDFDGDWECFQFRVQLQWDSGRLELEMFSDLFSCNCECTVE